ncbi:MAG: glycosyltransferase [bacterium]|nr:glycosyltransferase [bacterium]
MTYLCAALVLMVAAACAYLALGWITVWRFQKGCAKVGSSGEDIAETSQAVQECYNSLWPSVTQLKPIHKASDSLAAQLRSFVCQDYPGKQRIVLASSGPVEGINPEHIGLGTSVPVVWSQESLEGANRKIAAVARAAERIEGDYIVLSDADMYASPDLLRRVIQPFADDKVGMVTCLYIVRRAKSWGDIWEGINVADFSASVLVARQVEGITFGLGAVMAMRRQIVEELGGFAAFKDYLADDYQLGHQIYQRGYKIVLADTVIEDVAEGATFAEYFRHQLRWMRTYRVSRPGGFFAYIVTQGMFWALLLLPASQFAWWSWAILLGWMLIRACWCISVWKRLGGERLARYGFLAGIKDIFYAVLWLLSFFSSKVVWGEKRYKVGKDGKMKEVK